MILQKPKNYFTNSQKHHIIEEFLISGCSKREIWEKYTGEKEEHRQLLNWMRKLGYNDSDTTQKANFGYSKNIVMAKKKNIEANSIEDFEILQLKKRITELESRLKDAEMKAITYSTMVDIAEREFNISIRKKYNTKPSKS